MSKHRASWKVENEPKPPKPGMDQRCLGKECHPFNLWHNKRRCYDHARQQGKVILGPGEADAGELLLEQGERVELKEQVPLGSSRCHSNDAWVFRTVTPGRQRIMFPDSSLSCRSVIECEPEESSDEEERGAVGIREGVRLSGPALPWAVSYRDEEKRQAILSDPAQAVTELTRRMIGLWVEKNASQVTLLGSLEAFKDTMAAFLPKEVLDNLPKTWNQTLKRYHGSHIAHVRSTSNYHHPTQGSVRRHNTY
jgi:hypothetical protein